MPVDPELQPMLELMNSGPPLRDVPLELLRQGAPIPVDPPLDIASVVNSKISAPHGQVPVRIYHPSPGTTLPVLVYFHGGGFVLGSLDMYDSVLRALALKANCVIVSVDYRLAPEHRFPAAVHDSYAAVSWVHRNAAEIGGDPRRIAVGGDSAGGNLATVVATRMRDEGGPKLVGQLLVYPVTRLRSPMEGSMKVNGEGYFLRAIDMQWFEDMYLGNADDANHPHASPLLAKDLTGLPSAFVLTAEFDPLLDQGEAYAQRLIAAGVPCARRLYAGAIHGFFGMPAAIARRAVADAADWLVDVFAVES